MLLGRENGPLRVWVSCTVRGAPAQPVTLRPAGTVPRKCSISSTACGSGSGPWGGSGPGGGGCDSAGSSAGEIGGGVSGMGTSSQKVRGGPEAYQVPSGPVLF